MINILQHLGSRMVNYLVPTATAAAGSCACDPGSSWCTSSISECRCASNCVTITCWCPKDGCHY